MIERYFTFKIIGEAIGLGIFGVVIIALTTISVIQDIRLNRKIKLLKKHGFERYLHGVPSCGNGAFYGWKRESDGKRIRESEFKHWTYKKLETWIEEEK